jgi:hypothetical protein
MATEAEFVATIEARSDVTKVYGPVSAGSVAEGLVAPRRIQVLRNYSDGSAPLEVVDYGVDPQGQVVEDYNRNQLQADRTDALKTAAEAWLADNTPADWIRYRITQVQESDSYMLLQVLRNNGSGAVVDERWLLYRDGVSAPRLLPFA